MVVVATSSPRFSFLTRAGLALRSSPAVCGSVDNTCSLQGSSVDERWSDLAPRIMPGLLGRYTAMLRHSLCHQSRYRSVLGFADRTHRNCLSGRDAGRCDGCCWFDCAVWRGDDRGAGDSTSGRLTRRDIEDRRHGYNQVSLFIGWDG
jgi:hypothetical protein